MKLNFRIHIFNIYMNYVLFRIRTNQTEGKNMLCLVVITEGRLTFIHIQNIVYQTNSLLLASPRSFCVWNQSLFFSSFFLMRLPILVFAIFSVFSANSSVRLICRSSYSSCIIHLTSFLSESTRSLYLSKISRMRK